MKLSKGFLFVLLSTFFFILVTATESRAVTTHMLIIPLAWDGTPPVVTITINVERAYPDAAPYVLGTLEPSFLRWPDGTADTFKLNLDDTRVINPSPGEVINFTTGTNSFSLPVDDFNRIGDFYRINELSIAEQLVRAGPPYGSTLSLPPRQPGGGSPPVTPTINITTRTPERQVDMIARQRARAGTATPTSWLTVESSSFTAHFDVTGWTPDRIEALKTRINPYLPWQLTGAGTATPTSSGWSGLAQIPLGHTGPGQPTPEMRERLSAVFLMPGLYVGSRSGAGFFSPDAARERAERSGTSPQAGAGGAAGAGTVPAGQPSTGQPGGTSPSPFRPADQPFELPLRDETDKRDAIEDTPSDTPSQPSAGGAAGTGTAPAAQPAGGARVPQPPGAPEAGTDEPGGTVPYDPYNLMNLILSYGIQDFWYRESSTPIVINPVLETTPPENAPVVPRDETYNQGEEVGLRVNPPSGQPPATENASFVAVAGVDISESSNYFVGPGQNDIGNQASELGFRVVDLGGEKIILGVTDYRWTIAAGHLPRLEIGWEYLKKLDEAVDQGVIKKEKNFKYGMAVP